MLGTLAGRLGASAPEEKAGEGFHLLTKGNRLLIAGGTPRGTSHGIYTVLKELGCDWLMPGEIGFIAPRKESIVYPETNRKEVPAFVTRHLWYRGGLGIVTKEEVQRYQDWCRRHRLGVPDTLLNRGESHYWDQFIRKNKAVLDQHSEMYALVREPDGTRVRKGPQIEPTHPKVAEMMAQEIRDAFEKKGWEKTRPAIFPIGPADGEGYSVSPESIALSSGKKDPTGGGEDVTEQVIYLANQVLERLGDQYPNVTLTYLCYSVHGGFPEQLKPHPRINVIFAPINYSRLHATHDGASKSRAYYKTIVERWAALRREQGNRLGFYEYNWNLADNMLPFTRLHTAAEDIRMYAHAGVEWATWECTKAWSINGAHDYVIARMLWNPELDWKTVFHEYCGKAYGAAAPFVERHYLRLAELQKNSGHEAGSYHAAHLLFTGDFIAQAKDDFETALKQELTSAQRERVEYARMPLRTLELYLQWITSLNAFDFPQAKTSLDALLADWQHNLDRNSDVVAREVPAYTKILLTKTTEEALKYSAAPYRILWRLPDAMSTFLDPNDVGEQLNLYHPQVEDRHWLQSKTFSSNWEAQGLGFYREGSVWYRASFTLPEKKEGEGIGLFLGGFEDEALVWLNGRKIGSSGIKFGHPATFDLTDAAIPGGENKLAVQIRRNSKINELFLGGIFRPSFIFAGPPLSSLSSPVSEEKYRVLPGGEREKITD